MKTVTPVIKRTRVSTERYEVCPHCREEIGEKSTYMDEENYLYHRACMDKGPIKYIEAAKFEWPSQTVKTAAYSDDQWKKDVKYAIKASQRIPSIILEGQGSPAILMQSNLQIRKDLLPLVKRIIESNSLLSSLKIASGEAFETNRQNIIAAVTKTEEYLNSNRNPDVAAEAARLMDEVASMLSSLPGIVPIVAKVENWLTRSATVDPVDVPQEFLREDMEWAGAKVVFENVLAVNIKFKAFQRISSYSFNILDWRDGWHNGFKKLFQIPMPLDRQCNEWIKTTFGATPDNPTGKPIEKPVERVETPEVTDEEVSSFTGEGSEDVLASVKPTVVKLADGKFGLRIARSDLDKVFKTDEDGKATLSKEAVIRLAQTEQALKVGDRLVLPAKWGYWEIDKYPIGGDFHRCSVDMPFTVTEVFKPYKGTNVKGKTDDGKMIACDSSSCKPG